MKEPLGPPSPLEVAKVVSKPICAVPIKHFGTSFEAILEILAVKSQLKYGRSFAYGFLNDFASKFDGF